MSASPSALPSHIKWTPFKEFTDHHADRFWADRSLRINSEVSAKQAARTSQIVGLKQSELGFEKYFSSIGAPVKLSSGSLSESGEAKFCTKRPASEVLEADEGDESGTVASNNGRPHKKVAFLDDFEFSSKSGSDYIQSNPSSAGSSLTPFDLRFIDHLVGPGTTSSRLNTTNAHLIIEEVDHSEKLMDARRSMLKKQSDITEVSELLTINFIFDANFLKRHLSTDASSHLLSVPLPIPSESERRLLSDCSVFAASHSFQDTKTFVRDKIQTGGKSITAEILRSYTERPNLWLHNTSYPTPPPTLVQNEDSYTQAIVKCIIFGVVNDLELLDH
ncbi:hypothetical protein BGZ65_011352, partial [Modicella reniformis]